MVLQRGFKPPAGEVWTADMFKPSYRPSTVGAGAVDRDKAVLSGNLAKLKKHSAQFSKEGLEDRKQAIQLRKVAAQRRKTADQMRKDGADPQRIRDFMRTGV